MSLGERQTRRPADWEDFERSFGGGKSGGRREEPNIVKSILSFIPPGIYNTETKKILGILTAEDLLLAALILMIADSDENDDLALLIALVYIFMA